MKMKNNITLSVSTFCWMLLFLLGVIWGSSFYAVSIALKGFDPLEVVCFRVTIGAIVLIAISFILGDGLPGFKVKERTVWLYSFGMGFFTNAAPFSLLAWAQTKISSSFAGITMSLVPLITLTLAHFLVRDERLSQNKVFGLIIGFCGMLILLDGPKIIDEISFEENFKFKFACVCAAICYAIGSIITRRSPKKISKIAFASSGLLMASILILPSTIAIEELPDSIMFSSVAALIYLGVFSTGIATVILVYIIKTVGPTFLSLVNYLVPLWAIIFGMLFNAESIRPMFLLALLCIFLGMFISRIGVKKF